MSDRARRLTLRVERVITHATDGREWEVLYGRGPNPMYWTSCGPTFKMRVRADEFAKHIRALIRQGRAV